MRARVLAAALPILAAAAGCGPRYDHLTFEERTLPPLTVSLMSTSVSLPVGIAVEVKATPMTDDGPFDDDVPPTLGSSNTQVLGVAAVVHHDTATDTTSDVPRRWILFGVAEGTASLQVNVDGDDEPAIPVTVTPQ